MSNVEIDPSERLILISKTGGGKTEWAKYMLRIIAKQMPVVIVDPKELWLGKGRGSRAEDWETKKKIRGLLINHILLMCITQNGMCNFYSRM